MTAQAKALANYLRMREATKATTKTPRPTRVRGSQYPVATPVRK